MLVTESKRLGKDQWLVLVAAFLGWGFDGLEQGLFPVVARPALQDLMHVTDDALVGQWNGYIMAAFLIGAASGGLVFGWMGDRIGRVRSMAISIVFYSLFTGCGYIVNAPWQLGVFRFFAALGMGGEWALGVALVMESWPEKLRPLMAGVIGAASNVGFLLIALVAVFYQVRVDSWRWMMLAGAAPAILGLLVILFIPESQRWKESVKKGLGKPIREIFSRSLRKSTLLAIAFASIPLIGTWAAVSGWIPLWADQLAGKQIPHAKGWAQVMIAIGAIVGCVGAPLIGGRFGRRPAYFGLCALSLLICAHLFGALSILPAAWQQASPDWCVFLFGGLKQYNLRFLITCLFAGLFTAAFYGWLPLYLPELFPTRVRATGQGLSYNSGRIFAAAGALQMGQLMRFFEGDYPRAGATITLIYVLGLVLIWFAPETKGKPLPD
jgi:MFS family permease